VIFAPQKLLVSVMSDDLDLSWAAFETLRKSGAQTTTRVADTDTNRQWNCGSSFKALDYAHVVQVDDDDEEDDGDALEASGADTSQKRTKAHVCGSACRDFIINDEGSFTCKITGRVFGQQLCVGATDARLTLDTSNTLTVHNERKRKLKRDGLHVLQDSALMYSAATNVLHKILHDEGRKKFDQLLLNRTLKAISKLTVTSSVQQPLLSLLNSCYSELEAAGVSLVRFSTNDDEHRATTDTIAAFMNIILSTVLPVYVRIQPKPPKPMYLMWALAFLLSGESLGEKMRIPFLTSHMPDEKTLKNMGVNISRVTTAKRYILEAVKVFFASRRKSH